MIERDDPQNLWSKITPTRLFIRLYKKKLLFLPIRLHDKLILFFVLERRPKGNTEQVIIPQR